jgi:phospholipase C
MTRRTVFLAAIMVVASLGAAAQNRTTGASAPAQQNPAVQQTVQHNNNTNASPSTDNSQRNSPAQQNVAEQNAPVSNGQLPQTSTILPLLGLIGLGSLVAGFFSRR